MRREKIVPDHKTGEIAEKLQFLGAEHFTRMDQDENIDTGWYFREEYLSDNEEDALDEMQGIAAELRAKGWKR